MIEIDNFGVIDGKQIYKYTLSNNKNMKVVLSNFGATLLNLFVDDVDVALGYDKLEEYFNNPEYIGCVISPLADRTGKGRCNWETF